MCDFYKKGRCTAQVNDPTVDCYGDEFGEHCSVNLNSSKDEFITTVINTAVDKNDSKVNHPSHYNQGSIEVIDAIIDWNLDFCLGNAIKYITRCNYKNNKVEDLEKAIWYIQKEIELEGDK